MMLMNILCVVMVVLQSSLVLGAEVPKHVLPSDPHIYYSGRVNKSDSHWYKFDWSGIEISYTFPGSSIGVILQDQGNWYNAFVDGELVKIINTTQGQQQYDIDIPSSKKENTHQLLITKRTEAEFGIVSFGGFMIMENIGMLSSLTHEAEIQSSQPSFRHRLEFVGDSITCGYGNEGDSPSCPFSADTENNYKAWGQLVAEALDAEHYTVAWSGRGVVRNYGDQNPTSAYPFPKYYVHTLGNDFQTSSGLWNPSQYVPDAVVFNLGTNDFSTEPHPSQDVFESGYVNFVQSIIDGYKDHNPDLQVFLACGPLISDPCCSYVQNVVDMLNQSNNGIAYYVDMQNILTYPDDYGCSGHPNVVGDQKMAKVATPIIQQVMGW